MKRLNSLFPLSFNPTGQYCSVYVQWEPKTGQQKVQGYEDNPLCPSRYIIYLFLQYAVPWLLQLWQARFLCGDSDYCWDSYDKTLSRVCTVHEVEPILDSPVVRKRTNQIKTCHAVHSVCSYVTTRTMHVCGLAWPPKKCMTHWLRDNKYRK